MTRKSYLQGILPTLLLLMSVSAASAFDDPVSHPVGNAPTGVTIGDVDGDGLADVAAATGGNVTLLLNDGSGLGPGQEIPHGGGGGARSVAIEDVDGDGDRDLVVLVSEGNNVLVVLRNNGDGTFAAPEPHGAPDLSFALRMADVDRDGDPDALVVEGLLGASVRLLRNDGGGSFEFAGSYPLALPVIGIVYVADMDVADLSGDGYPDVAGCSDNSLIVDVLLNDGEGGLLPATPVDLGQQAPTAVRARDVNRDGRPDLLVVSCGANELRVGLNDGAGGFVLSHVVPLTGACHSITHPTGLASGYLDGDTAIDVVYASRSTDSVRLLRGLGDGTFEAFETLPSDPDPMVVAAGDVNGDGSHDVVNGTWIFSAPDSVVVTTNDICAPLLDQTVTADASRSDYFWATSLPYLAVRGTFVTAEDVSAFAVDRQFSANSNVLHDAELPLAGSGFWYLVRPDCVGASWTAAGPAELPGRDSALP